MKLLILLLLFPCCLSAQRFVVKDIRSYIPTHPKIWTPSYRLWVGNLEGTMTAQFDIIDSIPIAIRDTIYYDGQNWRWRKIFLNLYTKPQWEVLPKIQKHAYINKVYIDSNKYVFNNINNLNRKYGGAILVDCYHNFRQDARIKQMNDEMIQLLINELKHYGVNTLINKQ